MTKPRKRSEAYKAWMREYKKEWNKKHPEKRPAYTKKYRANNKEKYEESSRRVQVNRRIRLKEMVMAVYGGGQCACCGETEISFLTLDHINNDGAEHRKEAKGGGRGGAGFYSKLKQQGFPPGLQVLCFNCNMSKSFNGGTCAHQLQNQEE